MYGTRSLSLLGVLLGALFAGCVVDGGRGSSGFDITENFIISRVLETQECFSNDGLTFCPADRKDVATVTATPTAATPTAMVSPTVTPTIKPTPRVDTGLADGDSIACTREQPGTPCTLMFRFSVFGFPADATLRLASRLRAPNSDWVLSPAPMLDSATDPPTLIAPVSLPVPADANDPRVQFAVLVFLSPPDDVPAEFAVLADSGTDYAFVTSELELELITIGPPPTATETETVPAETPAETPSTTPNTPTATATATPPRVGPEITYFGVTRADSVPLAPSGFDAQGRPVYVRAFGYGISLIVEGRPGTDGRQVGRDAYTPDSLPDLQVIFSRPLGDGSRLVCDNTAPVLGGVPSTFPFAFGADDSTIDAINDLGCRVDDGTGGPFGRGGTNACTLDRSGEYVFVSDQSTTQFCVPISVPWSFPVGDTIVAARLRDVAGHLGPEREIVIRNAASHGVTPSPARPTDTPRPLPTSTRPTSTVTATRIPMSPSASPTPTQTATPPASGAPEITYLGLTRADDHPVLPVGVDEDNRPVFSRILGQGLRLVIEARQGDRALGRQAYDPDGGLPDLQIIVSRPLGNGSTALCDAAPPLLGGVPATDPLVFSDDSTVITAINDLGCRVDDGAGAPLGRPNSEQACTVIEFAPSVYGFVEDRSQLQYCLPIAFAWSFPVGDTIIAARVRDLDGRTSAVKEIVLHVGASVED